MSVLLRAMGTGLFSVSGARTGTEEGPSECWLDEKREEMASSYQLHRGVACAKLGRVVILSCLLHPADGLLDGGLRIQNPQLGYLSKSGLWPEFHQWQGG